MVKFSQRAWYKCLNMSEEKVDGYLLCNAIRQYIHKIVELAIS